MTDRRARGAAFRSVPDNECGRGFVFRVLCTTYARALLFARYSLATNRLYDARNRYMHCIFSRDISGS